VAAGGYLWWYLDALSDDGRHGITIIALVGNVFSPWYARARRMGGGVADPMAHVALNICVYGEGSHAWVYTERPGGPRDGAGFATGRSGARWEGDALIVDVDERTPWTGRPVRGRVRLVADHVHHRPYDLDPHGRHRWWPVAPHARVDVDLAEPGLRFSGSGYHDANHGDEPLERGFSSWDWSRANSGRDTVIVYDRQLRSGATARLALRFDAAGDVEPVEPPEVVPLGRTWWGLSRNVRADRPAAAVVERTLEDTPFYSRSVVGLDLLGARRSAIHESVDLDRFDTRWVQHLLGYRMRRERVTPPR
jgi:carotenoid 1,2-hydratase